MRIDSLAHGGAGVGRVDGRVVFVARTAPGDLVKVAATEGSLNARLLQILESGPHRVLPTCVHVGECEGCQWQHVDIGAQREAKRQSLIEALVRLGGVDRQRLSSVDLFSSPSAFRYRRRARFVVHRDGTLGYSGSDGRPGVVIRECHLLSSSLEQLALSLSQVMRRIAPRPEQLSLCVSPEGGSVLVEFQRPMALASLHALGERLLAEVPALSGAVVRAGDRVTEVGRVELEDDQGLLRPDAFAQANREMNALLVQQVLERLAPGPQDRVLELFSGSGNFTVPLASRAGEMVAIEREGTSLELCRRALASRGLKNVRALAADAARATVALGEAKERFDLVLLDPPRAGARELLPAVAALAPRRIAYVSCDPATLARDVKVLRTNGYELGSAAVFDQFPQTYHLEALAILDRFEP